MTPNELEAYIDAFAAETTGRVVALMHVVQVLQSQPGYDHERFRATLATLAVCAEEARGDRPSPMSPSQQRAFDETVEFFLNPPQPLPEAWIARPSKPESVG